jgi:PhzF family phenazine biosynthesis protein
MADVLRYAAFTDRPDGGNPAGVVPDAQGLGDAEMLRIAAEVGFSETAFLVAAGTPGTYDVRYFSPVAEVPFCGHATIAAGVALAERGGGGDADLRFRTPAGEVAVAVRAGRATLTSVPAREEPLAASDLDEALAHLRWSRDELDPALPPGIGFAGARHLVIAARTRARLADLDYDFDGLRDLMLRLDLTTVQLVWREAPAVFHARDPFPVGGVVEDPATGAAAAALGGLLRQRGEVPGDGRLTIHQGHDMGRPSLLEVELAADDRVRVTGRAVPIT